MPVEILNTHSPFSLRNTLTFPRILIAILLLWTCGVLFPAFPNPIGCGLDPSWEHGLNLAHAQHLVFGRDIIFTFGPLAYLGYPETFAVSPWLLLFWNLAIYAGSIYFLIKLLTVCQSAVLRASILILTSLSAAFKFGFGSAERLQITFLIASWFLLIECSFEDMLAFALAAITASISLLVKVNDGVTNIVVFYFIYCVALWRQRRVDRRALVIGLSPPAMFGLTFYLVNGSPGLISSYLRLSSLIANGYSEAMSIVGPSWQVALAIAAMVILFAIIITNSDKGSYRALFPTLFLSLAAFKHCMIRQDGHAVPFHVELAAIAGFGLLTLSASVRRSILLAFIFVNLCCGFWIAKVITPGIYHTICDFASLKVLPGSLYRYVHLNQSWRALETQTPAVLLPRLATPEVIQAVGNSSFEDLTWNVDYVEANHFRWNPQPVFQSYTAYEPALDSLNEAHLRKAGAEFLSLRYEDIDGRHPFLDNVSTWREVFNHYDIAGGGLDLLLLKRSPGHRFSEQQSLAGPARAAWGETIVIPQVSSNQLVLMYAKVGRSLWGSIRNLLFRTDPVYLEVTYRSGIKAKYRVSRPNLVNGAIISDLPRSIPEMFGLFGYGSSDDRDRVATIRWTSDDEAQFSPQISLAWFVMSQTASRNSRRLALYHPDTSSFVPLWKPNDGVAGASALQWEDTGNKLVLRPTATDPQVLLKMDRKVDSFNTILIRAKFSVSDQINLFFGRQNDGRGFEGYVPVAGQWLDIFVKVNGNPFWKNEAGELLRFDPVTNLFPHSRIEVAGVWGSQASFSMNGREMTAYVSQAAGAALPQ